MIKDDGVGISNMQARDSSLGLDIMQYRAKLASAFVKIRDGKDGGTEVLCRFEK